MKFDVTFPNSGAAVIRPCGRLNMTAAPELRDLVATAVREQGRSHVVVDLTATDFIDSSGLGSLIGGLKAARSAGGDLRIACPTTQVRLVLELTNMLRILRPYETVQDALL
ncbi:anti-sigma-factor antagonist [Nakamurella panacisegetis]|uniref:Anti-sigma factor antagonist n=1 Tax=Nakamurella panacisegetis TaxID=1090615 RepID=A0A1H0ISM3_9ACTN|nr:STAS domain-containing protein [Nakamurella panacisegetis]SDO34021.1 anti-sigma-factor antagonist [Nakamurella panacisegetis]